MRFKIIDKETGKEISSERMTINLHTGSIYRKGANVTPKYRIEAENTLSDGSIENLIYSRDVESLDKCLFCIQLHMKSLKGGALKALILIYEQTLLSKRSSAVLSNEQFKICGDHLTRRDYIAKATNRLVEMGLILKESVDAYYYKYTPIFSRKV